jgi:pyridoxamine 5'-phosphate oxidase family protein
MDSIEFTQKEIEYLEEQRLARIATVDSDDAQPDVAVVGYEYDNNQIHVAGFNIQKTIKYHHVRANPLVALVIDDLESVDPWRPRGIKIYGRAVTMLHGGREVISVTPIKKWSWGIEKPAFVEGTYNLQANP